MISEFFIDRPIFANVIAIVTVILGLVCLFILPVAQYPEIVPPTIQVTTMYPGASAEIIANKGWRRQDSKSLWSHWKKCTGRPAARIPHP